MKKLLIFTLVFGVSNGLLAYEIDMHRLLSQAAYEQSQIKKDSNIVNNLGFTLNDTFPNSEGGTDSFKIEDLIQLGAEFEDGCPTRLEPCVAGTEAPNKYHVFNHFYDPQQNIPLTLAGKVLGQKSIDWATERNGDYNVGSYVFDLDGASLFYRAPQSYSFKDARTYQLTALTASTLAERKRNAGLMFQSLGNIVHHLQDMAQPDHVRNDLHCPDPCKYTPFYDPSTLEYFTNELAKYHPIELKAAYMTNLPYPPVVFKKPEQYWENNGQGMAEFTAKNFVSPGTNFSGGLDNGVLKAVPRDSSKHPLPTGNGAAFGTKSEDVGNLSLTAYQWGVKEGELGIPRLSQLNGKVTFVTAAINDPYNNITHNDVKISTYSVFANDLKKHCASNNKVCIKTSFFSLNHFNYDSYLKVLLPRAVAFSAGMMDFFFRGKITLEKDTDSVWKINNRSTERMQGIWAVYYDESNGSRKLWDKVQSLDLTSNAKLVPPKLKFPHSYLGKKATLVFLGTLGEETGSVASYSFTISKDMLEESLKIEVLPVYSSRGYDDHGDPWGQGYQIINRSTETFSGNYTFYYVEAATGAEKLVGGINSYSFTLTPGEKSSTVQFDNPPRSADKSLVVRFNGTVGAQIEKITAKNKFVGTSGELANIHYNSSSDNGKTWFNIENHAGVGAKGTYTLHDNHGNICWVSPWIELDHDERYPAKGDSSQGLDERIVIENCPTSGQTFYLLFEGFVDNNRSVSYEKPGFNFTPKPCNQTVTYSGSNETVSYDFDLGTNSGTVDLSFTPYDIPDRITLYHDGIKIDSGYVGDYNSYNKTYYYSPAKGRIATVTVYGNKNSDTKWDFFLGCPK